MVAILIGILVVVLLFVVVLAASRRTPASDDGVADFRRHLSALSPEARRVVLDREREHREAGDDRVEARSDDDLDDEDDHGA